MQSKLKNSTPTNCRDARFKHYTLAWTIFITACLYYCFAYLLRVYPSVMTQHIEQHFQITASSFGMLTAFYYFAYAPVQLPVGVSVDKIGPRRSLIFASICATTGAFLFATTDIFALALVGRFMIGLGSAFAYVTGLKLASVWLPKRFFATATGAVTGFGMIAAIFTDIYLTHVIEVHGAHDAIRFPVMVGVVLIVLILLVIRDRPEHGNMIEGVEDSEAHALSYHQLYQYIRMIAKNPQMWIIGLVGALLYMPASVFLDVWAIPYLETVHEFTANQAADGVSVMLAGWIISTVFTGFISDKLGTRKAPLLVATLGATIVSTTIIFVAGLSVNTVFVLLFLLGVFCGPHPLCFTLSKENNDSTISGTAVSFANFMIMMGGFVFQPVVGKLLDLGWTGGMANGIRIYSPEDFMWALGVLPVGLLIAFLATLKIKETYVHAVVEHHDMLAEALAAEKAEQAAAK